MTVPATRRRASPPADARRRAARLARRAADGDRRHPAARRPQRRERDGRRGGHASPAASTAAAVRAALAGFAGVEHRLEEVARVGDVLYVDDSKATNVASAVVGIRSFAGGVHVILGGRGKHEDYAPLAAAVAERCRAAYLIGEEEERLTDALADTGVPARRCGDLHHAVAAARAAAAPGEVVLLSPACASYDQYRSFNERGDEFKALAAGA